jgi:hypothetical protein
MAANAGSLTVALGLDAAQYLRGLTKAEADARKFSENLGATVQRGALLAAGSLAAVGLAATAAFNAFKSQSDAIDAFNDLADASGASVENISALDRVARETGSSFATAESVLLKFNQALANAKPDNDAGRLLKAMNLDIAQLKSLDPAEALRQTAVAFAGYENNGNKARAMQELFGKSTKEAAPFLNDLAEKTALVGTTNAQAAQQAEIFNKQIYQLQAFAQDTARSLVSDLLPALNKTLKNFKDLREQGSMGLIVKDAAKAMIGLGKITGDNGADVNKFIAERERLQKTLQFAETKGLGTRGIKEDLDEVTQYLKIVRLKQANEINGIIGQDFGDALSRKLNKPVLLGDYSKPPKVTGAGSGSGDDPTKRVLENALKFQENAARQEEDMLRIRNQTLDLYYGANLISTKAYFSDRQAAQDKALAGQMAAYDNEIAALEAYKAKAGKAPEQEAAQGKINDLLAKKTTLTRDAEQATLALGFAQRKANEGYAEKMQDINATVLELKGSLAAAAGIRLDAQFKDITALATLNGDTAGLALIGELQQAERAKIAFSAASTQAQQIQSRLAVEEQRIQLDRELGIAGEIESLNRLGQARAEAAVDLEKFVGAQVAAANESGNAALKLQAAQEQLNFKKILGGTDPLALKFDTDFKDSLGGAFADVVTGAKTAKDAIKGFEQEVVGMVSRLAAQQVSESLFKSIFGGTGGGSPGSFMSGLFGGKGGGGFDLGSIFSGLFGFAGGGMVAPGQLVRVNENGPELIDYQGKQFLMTGDKNVRVTANSGLGGGARPITINVTAQPNMSRATSMQQGRDIARALQNATSRNG